MKKKTALSYKLYLQGNYCLRYVTLHDNFVLLKDYQAHKGFFPMVGQWFALLPHNNGLLTLPFKMAKF